LQPAHANQVHQRPQDAVADVVLGLPVESRPVVDRHLGHAGARQQQQGGQEAVHAVERRNAVQTGGAVGAQGAADVGDRFARNPVADPVRDARRGPPQPGVLSTKTDAADDIKSVEAGEKPRDVRRIVLQVGVEGDHGGAAGVAEAGRERRRLAAVAAQPDHPHAVILLCQRAQDLRAAIRAAVVHVDGFVGLARRSHRRLDLGRQEGQALGFIEERDDHRNLRLTSAHGRYRSRLR
jgi:hypothetical protein